MPTYEYECQSCHERVEAVQKFADPTLTICPFCGGELRKVFSAVGIVFKGSGFYKNDSRGAKSTSSTAGADGDAKSPSPSGDSTTPTDDAKGPAAPVPAPSASTSSPSSSSSTSKSAPKAAD
jgi:putative FmdB family regulatory protein